ncbi:MAG: tetratricopeptide repeat protein [Ardenticatenaceae bacterium]|nr:tetratricopeptide repeat protein [Ardenticatenaceae bacterium]
MDQSFEKYQKQGTFALQQGQISEALTLLEKALALQPDNVDTRLNLSSALILKKRFKEAVPILEGLTAEQPNNAMFWLNLGAAYLGNPIIASDENQQKAIAAFEKAIKIDDRTPNAAYNLGLVHRDRREYRRALYWFEQAAEAFPDDKDAHQYIEKMLAKVAENDS